jgi:hypothetical protein
MDYSSVTAENWATVSDDTVTSDPPLKEMVRTGRKGLTQRYACHHRRPLSLLLSSVLLTTGVHLPILYFYSLSQRTFLALLADAHIIAATSLHGRSSCLRVFLYGAHP